MSQQIFRKEYLNKKPEIGQILILSGMNQRIMTLCCIIIISAFILLISFGTYTKKIYIEGVIVPSNGLITVKSTQSGIIKNVEVVDGQNVSESERILILNNETFDNNGISINERLKNSILQQISSLKSQKDYEYLMNKSRINELNSKVSRLELEISSANQSLELAKEKTNLKKQSGESYSVLLNKKYISDLTFKEYLSSLVSLQADEESKKLLIQQLEREHVATGHQIDYIELQGSMRNLELTRQIDNLNQQQIELTSSYETIIRSPINGQITALRAESGQAVNQGEILLNIIPKGAEFQVELYAPSRAIGFIKKGHTVGLRFDAFPYEKFGVQKGTVLAISQSTVSPAEIKAQDQTIRLDTETLYKIVVTLNKPTIDVYGIEQHFKVGMKVNANINIETRRLYEWLLGPISRIKEINQ